MNPFSAFQPLGHKALQAKPLQIRRETVRSTPSNVRKPLGSTLQRSNRLLKPQASSHKIGTGNRISPGSGKRSSSTRKRGPDAHLRLDSDSDGSSSEDISHAFKKRRTPDVNLEPDYKRQLRYKEVESEDAPGLSNLINAADIMSGKNGNKYKPAFPELLDATEIQLQYPSGSHRERYALVDPIHADDFKALEDIQEVLEIVTTFYLSPAEAELLKDDSHGLLRRLKRATDKRKGSEYISLIEEWNSTLHGLVEDGSIAAVLDDTKSLDLKLIERILTQIYSRTVSPNIEKLRHYQNGTDNVYGELLPKFISNILRRDTKMKSDQIFVDLGSGVGNVVLQAALEVGCESWGCEMMENACALADDQAKEFRARCRLWGIQAGKVHLQRGNFLENAAIQKILPKADVILINNQAFTPELNESLTRHFLDLKDGCLIVSLKSFVPHDHQISERNKNNPCNVLDVTEKEYFSACVSWTDALGTYYVSKKDSTRPQRFLSKKRSVG